MKIPSASCRVSACRSARSLSPSPSRSSPRRRSVWIVTPCLVAPPGSSGSSTKPPSRATISFAISEIFCIGASPLPVINADKAGVKGLTAGYPGVRRSAPATRRMTVIVAARFLVDALLLERIHHFLGHVILVMLGQDFARLEDAVAQGPGTDHALIFLEQVGQHATIGHRHRRPAIGHVEADRLARAAHQASALDQPANAEHLG